MNKYKLEFLKKQTEEDATYIESIVGSIVSDCCDKLDKYVKYVSDIIADNSYEVTDAELDDIIMTLPALLYYVGDAQEHIGIRSDIAETAFKTQFNDFYMEADGAGPIRKAYAENKLADEILISIVYNKAYDVIKQKVTIAIELLQSAKKIMTRRMQSFEMERSAPNKDRSEFQ